MGAQRDGYPDPNVALDAGGLRKALPDLQSMPTGWQAGVVPLDARDVPWAERCRKDSGSQDCSWAWSSATVQYKAPGDSGSVYIMLRAQPDREVAGTVFKNRKSSGSKQGSAVSMPTVGNESTAIAEPRAAYAEPSISITMRVGTVIAVMTYQDSQKNQDSSQVLLGLAKMQAQRLLQAEQGQNPTAAAG